VSDNEKALRIALLTFESLALARGMSTLTFNELAAQYGRDVGVTAEMAREAFDREIVPTVGEIRATAPPAGGE
jgi:hypothetical protein